MAVFAHPDDEFTISPLLAKYAKERHTIYLVIATKGELGVTEHAEIPACDTLALKRAGEAACSCEKLGIKPLVYSDLVMATDIAIDDSITKLPQRHKLTPHGMVYSLYWLATADYQDPSIVAGLKPSDSWTTKIDIGSVPVVQVYLNGLDNGRYKTYIEYGKTANGNPFSVWQRSTQISGWISTNIESTEREGKTEYAGEIEITDQLKTITLRKRPSDTASIRVFSIIFEKIGRHH